MTITVNNDDRVRSHEEALQVLRYAVPGASVELHHVKSQPGSERFRSYTIHLQTIGFLPVTTGDLYSLPCRASSIASRAKELAELAHQQAKAKQ